MKTIQLQSEVGNDGILDLCVPLGAEEAGHRVNITIEPIPKEGHISPNDRADWHRFIEETYGSCAGMALERPDQGDFEMREPIE